MHPMSKIKEGAGSGPVKFSMHESQVHTSLIVLLLASWHLIHALSGGGVTGFTQLAQLSSSIGMMLTPRLATSSA